MTCLPCRFIDRCGCASGIIRAEKARLETEQERLEEGDRRAHDAGDLDNLSTDDNPPDGVEHVVGR